MAVKGFRFCRDVLIITHGPLFFLSYAADNKLKYSSSVFSEGLRQIDFKVMRREEFAIWYSYGLGFRV